MQCFSTPAQTSPSFPPSTAGRSRFPRQNAHAGGLFVLSLDHFAGLSHPQTLLPALRSGGFEKQTRKTRPRGLWLGKSYSLALLGLTGSGCSYGCSGGLSGLSLRFPKGLQSCLNPSPSTCSLYLGEARGSRGDSGIGMRVSQVLRRRLLVPCCTGWPLATPSVPMPLCLSTGQRGPP